MSRIAIVENRESVKMLFLGDEADGGDQKQS